MNFLPSLVLLAGCSSEVDSSDTAKTGGGETAETGDTAPTATTFGFDIMGEVEGSTLTLTWVDVTSFATEELIFGDVIVSVAAAARTELALEPPEEDSLREVAEGVSAAWYVPALHTDLDADGVPSAAEGYSGVGATWPVFVQGDPTGAPGLEGAVEGWNALQVGLSDGTSIAAGDVAAVPLGPSLALQTSVTLSGTWSTTPPDSSAVALVSLLALNGETVEERTVYDQAAVTPWSITLDGSPPEDHFAEQTGGLFAAVEVSVAYEDTDGDGAFGRRDTDLYRMCAGTTPLGLIFVARVPTLSLGLRMMATGNGGGWNALTLDGTGQFADDDLLTGLVIGPECPV